MTTLYGQQGQPIGTMLVSRREREIMLVDIALFPAHRNAGVGTKLVKALMEEAAGAGKTVRLHVLATSVAVKMYERLGFKKGVATCMHACCRGYASGGRNGHRSLERFWRPVGHYGRPMD